MDIFNNREIALAIWLFVGIVIVASKKSIREAFHVAWKASFQVFFCRLILVPFALMTGYIGWIVHCLHKIGLWDLELLKNTVL